MKIAHSIIVLTSIVFVSGSMLTVGMDLKATTDNISTNVKEAKYEHDKNMYLQDVKTNQEKENKQFNGVFKIKHADQGKMLFREKLESLNQNNGGQTKNRPFANKRI